MLTRLENAFDHYGIDHFNTPAKWACKTLRGYDGERSLCQKIQQVVTCIFAALLLVPFSAYALVGMGVRALRGESKQRVSHGNIVVTLVTDRKTQAVFVRVVTERLRLEMLTEKRQEEYRNIFGERIEVRPDRASYEEFYCDDAAMKNYGRRRADTPEELDKRLDLWGGRPLKGDPYTGFAIVHREKNKIIGNVSLGHGDEPGRAQCGLIVHPEYRKQGVAKETALAIGALALGFVKGDYQLDGKPLEQITATVLKENVDSLKLFKRIGLTNICETEQYSKDPRELWGIKVEQLKELLNTEKIQFNLETI